MSMKKTSSVQALFETLAHSKKKTCLPNEHVGEVCCQTIYDSFFFSNAELLIFLLLPLGTNQMLSELTDY